MTCLDHAVGSTQPHPRGFIPDLAEISSPVAVFVELGLNQYFPFWWVATSPPLLGDFQ